MEFHVPRLYRRDGTPYPEGDEGVREWATDLENDALRRVLFDKLPDGTEVSTVWIGCDLDHWSVFQNLPHVPIIFETMVWDPENNIVEQQRYRTENDAIVGHAQMVAKWIGEGRSKRN